MKTEKESNYPRWIVQHNNCVEIYHSYLFWQWLQSITYLLSSAILYWPEPNRLRNYTRHKFVINHTKGCLE